jgi:hypothetical protein
MSSTNILHAQVFSTDIPATAAHKQVALTADPYGTLNVAVQPSAITSEYSRATAATDGYIATSAGTLLDIMAVQVDSGIYIQLHDISGTCPAANAVPKLAFPIATIVQLSFANGKRFTNGITWTTSSALGTYVPCAGTAAIFATYK